MTKLVFGCGYLGLRVAQRWLRARHQVYAVTRSRERANELQKLGLLPLVADVTEPASLHDLPGANTVLYAVGYDRTAGRSIAEVYVDGLRNVLMALPANTGRFIYVSSTGVYGQSQGEWVDENSPCQPVREGGKACLEAEQLLAQRPWSQRAVILRLGGIYGPGRVPRRRDLEEGRAIAASENGYLNLIHVEDAANVVLAAEAAAETLGRFNVTDGHPVLRGDYFRELTRLAGAPPPTFAPPTDARAERASTDKRVSNRKMMEQLRVTLDYPTYREGLAAIFASE